MKKVTVKGTNGPLDIAVRKDGKRLMITKAVYFGSRSGRFTITHKGTGAAIARYGTFKQMLAVFEGLDSMPEWDKLKIHSTARSSTYRKLKKAVQAAFDA